jgi:two-component system, OmpR family, sensor histidine kinase KdpD
LHVHTGKNRTEEKDRTLASNKRFAGSLNAEVVEIEGKSVPLAIAAFVREKRATQVILGRSAVRGLRKYLYYWAVQRLLQNAPFVDVHIITQE